MRNHGQGHWLKLKYSVVTDILYLFYFTEKHAAVKYESGGFDTILTTIYRKFYDNYNTFSIRSNDTVHFS